MHTSRTAHANGSGADQHPGLETLAAFLDGKLPDAERARVMKHLAACKACFSLFADTARTLRELEPAGGKVLRFPLLRNPALRRTLPAAAAAVLVLAMGAAAYAWFWRPPRMVVADLVDPLADEPGLSDQTLEQVFRSGADVQPLAYQGESFLLGVRLVVFQLCVEAGNSGKATDAAQRIVSLLDDATYPQELARFREARVQSGESSTTDPYRNLVAEVSPALEEGFLVVFTDFGKWTAAGRLSALAQNPTFFERRENRRFLKLLLENPTRLDPERQPVVIDEEVRDRLREVAAIWDAGRLDEAAYDKLAGLLKWILVHYEEMTADYDL